MKNHRDERYQRYLNIIFNWSERHPLQHGVQVQQVRKELYGPEDFYCFGIARGNFVEPKDYDESKEIQIDDKSKKLVKIACCDERLDLDMLEELNKELKAAGAKKVYLHPDERRIYKENRLPFDKETPFGTQLLLIQDEEVEKK